MIQNIKSILIGLTKEYGPEETSCALGYGLSLAQQTGAHATVQAASVKLMLSATAMSGPIAGLLEFENKRLHALAEAAARAARDEAAAGGVICTTHTPHLAYPRLLAAFARQARLHDVTILDAEPSSVTADRGLIEGLLIDGGRPVLIVPPGWEAFRCRRIVLAWDGSAKAARAAADALPFLRAAESVEVVSVEGEKDLADTIRGADIAPHLSRHGVKVSVHGLAAANGDVAATLRDAVPRFEADMIVMGGYVHSRLREMFLGGVTQSLLRQSPVPLFMAH